MGKRMRFNTMKAVTFYGVVALAVVSACGGEHHVLKEGTKPFTLRVETQSAGLNLDSDSYPFLGLGVLGAESTFKPSQLSPGSHTVTLPVNVPLTFRARVLGVKQGEGGGYRYYLSNHDSQRTLLNSESEIVLGFGDFTEVHPTAVYGVAYADEKPATGWTVRVVDPHTGSSMSAPGVAGVTTTGVDGQFSFRYLFHGGSWGSSSGLHLEFTNASQVVSRVVKPGGAVLPGTMAGYLNLTNTTSVEAGAQPDDFDGDGYTNLAETAMGTNPFAVNAGLCTDPSQVLAGYAYTCPDGTQKMGLLEMVAGQSCWDVLGDLNGDGKADAEDCRGPQGIPGARAAARSSTLLPGTECPYGGVRVETWVDFDGDGKPSGNRELATFTSASICGANTTVPTPTPMPTPAPDPREGRALTVGGVTLGSLTFSFGGPAVKLANRPLRLYQDTTTPDFFIPVVGATVFESSDCRGTPYAQEPMSEVSASPTDLRFVSDTAMGSPALTKLIRSRYTAPSPMYPSPVGASPCSPMSPQFHAIGVNSNAILVALNAGLQKSTDGGSTWSTLAQGGAGQIPSGSVMRILVDNGLWFAQLSSGSWYRSTDGGVKWTAVAMNGISWDTFQPRQIVFHDGLVFTDSEYYRTTYVSDDLGESWVQLGQSHGLERTDALLAGRTTHGVWLSHTSSLYLFDKTLMEVLRVGGPLQNNNVIQRNSLISIVDGQSVWTSSDGGFTYRNVFRAESETERDIFSIVSFDTNGSVVAAAGSEGLSISQNGGGTWALHNIGTGLPLSRMRYVTVSPGGGIAALTESSLPHLLVKHGTATLAEVVPEYQSTWLCRVSPQQVVWFGETLFVYGMGQDACGGYYSAASSTDGGATWLEEPLPSDFILGQSIIQRLISCGNESPSVQWICFVTDGNKLHRGQLGALDTTITTYSESTSGFGGGTSINTIQYFSDLNMVVVGKEAGGVAFFDVSQSAWSYEFSAEGLGCTVGVSKVVRHGAGHWGVLCSDGSGRHFVKRSGESLWVRVDSIGTGPNNSTFVGESGSEIVVLSECTNAWSFSVDDGFSWDSTPPLDNRCEYSGAVNGSTLYSYARDMRKLFVSSDKGATWASYETPSYIWANRLSWSQGKLVAFSSQPGGQALVWNTQTTSWSPFSFGVAMQVYPTTAITIPSGISWPFTHLEMAPAFR